MVGVVTVLVACPLCGASFTPTKKRQLYCSRSCGAEHARRVYRAKMRRTMNAERDAQAAELLAAAAQRNPEMAARYGLA